MPSNPLATAAVAICSTFLTGMFVGLVLMLWSLVIRRRGSAVAGRLLLSGPPAGLCAAALFMLVLDLPVTLKAVLSGLFLVTGIPLLAAVLRAEITVAPIGGERS